MLNKKIKSQKELIKIVQKLKKQGKKIVSYNGSFDILHIGHVKSIQEAKRQGDVLIILLNSDKSIQSYKGPFRPLVSQEERAELLSALEDVDYISIFNDINPKKILDEIKPDIHCNGSDWGKNCIEREVVEKNGGKIYVLKWESGYSTTSIVEKIINVYKKSTIKAVFLDRDGTINYDKGFVYKIEDFEFIPGTLEALKKLSQTEYKLIVITNQSGIGRGYFSEEDFKKLNDWMIKKLKKEGINIDKIYYCSHHPEDGCNCRKPGIQMLLQAVEDYGISLKDSWFIGDSQCDIVMGRESNVKTIKIGEKMSDKLKLEPNYYAKDLLAATEIILNHTI